MHVKHVCECGFEWAELFYKEEDFENACKKLAFEVVKHLRNCVLRMSKKEKIRYLISGKGNISIQEAIGVLCDMLMEEE